MLKFLRYVDYFVAFANHQEVKTVSEERVSKNEKETKMENKVGKGRNLRRQKEKESGDGEGENKRRGQETDKQKSEGVSGGWRKDLPRHHTQ